MMQLKSILFAGAIAMASQTQAQNWVEDSVTMGASYANDVFYSLSNGSETAVDAANWHLAFQMTSFGDPTFTATVRSNYVKGKVEVYSLHLAAATSFTTLTANDTIGKTDPNLQLINVDSTDWGDGAFSQNKGTNPFDFGWGLYQGPPNHNLLGDSIYLVKVNGAAYKLWLKEYISMGGDTVVGYKFEIGTLDGSSPVVSNYVTRANYSDRLFAYYNITTNTFLNREPSKANWDLLFTQYPKPMVFGPVPGMLQAYTGVLINDTLKVAELQSTDPNLVTASNYNSYWTNPSRSLNVIGDDWKSFSGIGYTVDTMKSWIIRTNTGAYYQLGFTYFGGGATGKAAFRTKLLANATAVSTINTPITALSFYPNPVSDQLYMLLETDHNMGATQLTVMDITGRLVYNTSVQIKNGLNAYQVPTTNFVNGNYIITLTNGNWKTSQKIIVRH